MITALMVTKDEGERYLEPALDWLTTQVDQVFVYDDDSTDNTREIAANYAVVARKQPSVPSFLEHEGRFRTAALRTLETVVQPSEGDWIFIADADEFFVPNTDSLGQLVDQCQPHHRAVRIRIHTVWNQGEGGELLHRVDGPWSTLYEPRLWKWQPNLAFADAAMACRNEPVFVTMNIGLQSMPHSGSAILHYGYASPADRAHRYTRYSSLPDHGHSPVFIESIMDPRGEWETWAGEVPCGIR